MFDPSTSKVMHFFTQSSSSFHKMRPYHLNLFHCTRVVTSCIANLCCSATQDNWSLNLTPHIHLIILISTSCNTISMPGHKKRFQNKKILKFQDIFQDIKPCKHAEKVSLKSSKNTVVTQNQYYKCTFCFV